MANHKSALKRIRSNNAKRLRNRYHARTMRSSIRKFRALTDKKEAEAMINDVFSIIDKNAKRNIIHKKKAANLKSKLKVQLNKM
jgi:small subunit ribosomal protein S20